jgi:membrane associated rhomboid family serine protease
MDFSSTPITLLLIAANVIFSMIGFSNQSLLDKTIGWPYYTKRKNQYYRFITSGFLHGDWIHLIFNMFTLFFFGSNIEFIFSVSFNNGQLWYVLLYFFGLVAADIPSYIKHKDNVQFRSLGASGAVSAVVFASIVLDPWSQIQLYGFIKISALVFAILYRIVGVYMGKQNLDNLNHDAHLWGSLFGVALMVVLLVALRPDVFPYVMEDVTNPSIMGRTEPGAVLRYLLTSQ